jgi:hypothetical protein
VAANRVLLVVLEDRGVRRLLALEDDVENRVQAARAGQDAAQLPLGDADRMRRVPASVQDTRDQTLPAQPTGRGGTARLALADFQLDSFSGHSGGGV